MSSEKLCILYTFSHAHAHTNCIEIMPLNHDFQLETVISNHDFFVIWVCNKYHPFSNFHFPIYVVRYWIEMYICYNLQHWEGRGSIKRQEICMLCSNSDCKWWFVYGGRRKVKSKESRKFCSFMSYSCLIRLWYNIIYIYIKCIKVEASPNLLPCVMMVELIQIDTDYIYLDDLDKQSHMEHYNLSMSILSTTCLLGVNNKWIFINS